MKKIIFICLLFFVVLTGIASAGSYTLNTTAGQDTKLAIIAAGEGVSIGVLLQNIVIDNIASRLTAIDNNKRLAIRLKWNTLTDNQKDSIASIIKQ